MSERKRPSAGLMVLTASVVGVLLSIGLCSVRSWEGASQFGVLLFLLSVLAFFVGLVMTLLGF